MRNFKKEGDYKSPAGIFKLWPLFGRGKRKDFKMPYLEMSKNHYWVDDPTSIFYNQLIDVNHIAKNWNSAEEMLLDNRVFNEGFYIQHNQDPKVSGAGSCIFMHKNNQSLVATLLVVQPSLVKIFQEYYFG